MGQNKPTHQTIDNLSTEDKRQVEGSKFTYQEKLTPKLDALQGDFTQDIINEIVLWKVNRYALLESEVLTLLNQVDGKSVNVDTELQKNVLRALLACKGISLPMTSTILRFKNPNVFQILDQRVYRYIYGEEVKYSTKIENLVIMYFEYLDTLRKACHTHDVAFRDADRILYMLDKKLNANHPLKGY